MLQLLGLDEIQNLYFVPTGTQQSSIKQQTKHLICIFFRNEYATFKEIRTKTITVQGQKGDSKKAKLFITLQRSENFFENMRKFNEIREENERLQAKNAAANEGEGEAKAEAKE